MEDQANQDQSKPGEQPDYLTPKELANKLHMSVKFVETNTQARRIPGQEKIGRCWRYRRADIENALLHPQFLIEKPRKNLLNPGIVGTSCSMDKGNREYRA